MKLDRNALIESLAQHMTDNADLDTLMEYFYDGTVEFLDDLSDEDLLNEAEWNTFSTKKFEVE